MLLYERLAHAVIGSPFQDFLEGTRDLSSLPTRWKNPGLEAIYKEDRYIKQLIQMTVRDGMNCIDIGAHIGSVLDLFHRVSPSGEHIAFEALPYKSEWLRRKYPNVEVHSIALSDRRGQTTFHYNPNKSGFSGLRQHQAEHPEETVILNVAVAPLDELIPVAKPIRFIKVDVEGAELRVLRGALNTIRRCQPVILFECTQSGLDLFDVSAAEMHQFFEQELGYQIFVIPDYLVGRAPLSADEFQAAMHYPFRAFNFVALPC